MRPNPFPGWAITLLTIALLALHGCERLEQNSPTGVEATIAKPAPEKSSLPAYLSSPPDIIVTTTSDLADFDGGQQVSDLPGPDGLVSLREAIIAANNTAGPNVIGFNISTSDAGFDGSVFTIQPHPAQLPELLDDGTIVDGASQSAFTGNTNAAGPEIFLDGNSIDPNVESHGIGIASAANHIHGLAIGGFSKGVSIGGDRANDNHITGCFVGLAPDGVTAHANRMWGVCAANFASGILIGGPAPAERNVISGNDGSGIWLANYLQHATIQNNYIGTDAGGLIAVRNGSGIIVTDQCHDILIQGSVISGNLYKGIGLRLVHDIRIEGNIIGPDAQQDALAGNEQQGIAADALQLGELISQLIIGGTASRQANLIAWNPQGGIIIGATLEDAQILGNTITRNGMSGIHIYGSTTANTLLIARNAIHSNFGSGVSVNGPGTGYTISQNSFYTNDMLGIELAPDYSYSEGVSPNDPGDADTGPNDLMNYPVLESAKATPGKLIVKGYIDTPNPITVTIEFFANPVPDPGGDPTGHGEGAIYLGSDRPNAQGKFTATLPAVAVGTLVTATATDAAGNTSEFALNLAATGPGYK
ncbi:right-handed parallel beta-helix repeat-containing protein [candidate division KSB1 bacterium]|nr:right-handed parallel beta-helix repeat-containing protein [bacterium]NUM67414.1 right-handed parallel beta-helix repeat-containing protein [candidate division KSB1 bacterium]